MTYGKAVSKIPEPGKESMAHRAGKSTSNGTSTRYGLGRVRRAGLLGCVGIQDARRQRFVRLPRHLRFEIPMHKGCGAPQGTQDGTRGDTESVRGSAGDTLAAP